MGKQDVDILIVGGGLIGASLMLALAHTPYRVMLVEATPLSSMCSPDFDARSLALSPASVRILQMLHVWELLAKDACAIDTIQVSERFGWGCAHLRGDGAEPLGFVVELQHINHALHQRLDMDNVLAPAELVAFDKDTGVAVLHQGEKSIHVTPKLIVAADGSDSSVRKLCGLPARIKPYHQHAIVANIGLQRSHQQVAFERFTSQGPLALLPMNGLRASMVWALSPDESTRMMALNSHDFLSVLQRTLGYRLGRLVTVGRRVSYPLQQVMLPQQTLGSVVFVGNAAHTLHPVAGQGFNLGLRDVAMLAQCIVEHGLQAPLLSRYTALREVDQNSIAQLTDGLIQVFTSHHPLVKWARRAGLVAFEQLPILKMMLSRYARGYAGVTPDLVCGISIGRD